MSTPNPFPSKGNNPKLCEVRMSELDKIIELLIKPDQAYVENNAPVVASSNIQASSESSEKNSQKCVIS